LARYTIYAICKVCALPPRSQTPSSSPPGKKGSERGKSKCFMLIPLYVLPIPCTRAPTH
jgi:hypothetical protein